MSDFSANSIDKYSLNRVDMVCQPLFSDWSHTKLSVFDYPADYRPETVITDTFTATTHHLILLYLPPQPLQLKAPHLDDPTYFWTKITPGTEEDTKTLESNIELAYGKESYRHTCLVINCDFEQITESIKLYNKRIGSSHSLDRIPRHCFQFVADNSHDKIPETGKPCDLLAAIPFPQIIEQTATRGIHIIDCDFAGSIYPEYKNVLNQLREKNRKTNIFAFFSCSANERNPRSSGLPADLFSSCLNSPGKMALLWHSSHYFCFKSGPLQPIHIDDLSQASPELIKTIDAILRGYIESMACKVLKHKDFIKYFMMDEFVARCICGFIMAQKILDFFNLHPMSDPPLPDLRDNPMWQSFSLQLDEALYMFRQRNQNFKLNKFLSYNMQTINLLLECDSTIVDFYPYLSVMHEVLLSEEHWKEGCRFLANFIDGDREALDTAWLFPLIEPMNKLLSEGKNDPYLLFIIAKSLCYAPQCRRNFCTTLDTVFMKNKLLDYTLNKLLSLSSIIIVAINFRFFKKLDNHDEWKKRIQNIIRFPWREYVERMIMMGEDQAVWTLLFISSVGEFILDDFASRIFDLVARATYHKSPNVRAAALYCLASFLKWKFEHKIFDICHRMKTDISTIVRSQLICTLVPLYDLAMKNYRNDLLHVINKDIEDLCKDPFAPIAQMAAQFKENHLLVPESSLYDHFIEKFLGKSIDIITGHTKDNDCGAKVHLNDNIKFSNNQIKKGTTLDPLQNISSNVFVSESYLFLGLKTGVFGSIHLPTSPKPQFARLSPNSITAITSPLPDIVFAGDSRGKVFGMKIPSGGGQMGIATAFDTVYDSQISIMKCSALSSMLGVTIENSNDIHLIDLESERFFKVLKPRNEQKILGFSFVDDLKDTVLIVGDETVELVDMRSPNNDSYLSFQAQRILGADFAGCKLDLCVVGKNSGLSVIDVRKPESPRAFSHPPAGGDLIATCFATHPSARLCAVGSNRGVAFFDLEDENHTFITTSTSVLFGSAKLHPVTDIAFHPKRLFATALVENTEIYTFTEM